MALCSGFILHTLFILVTAAVLACLAVKPIIWQPQRGARAPLPSRWSVRCARWLILPQSRLAAILQPEFQSISSILLLPPSSAINQYSVLCRLILVVTIDVCVMAFCCAWLLGLVQVGWACSSPRSTTIWQASAAYSIWLIYRLVVGASASTDVELLLRNSNLDIHAQQLLKQRLRMVGSRWSCLPLGMIWITLHGFVFLRSPNQLIDLEGEADILLAWLPSVGLPGALLILQYIVFRCFIWNGFAAEQQDAIASTYVPTCCRVWLLCVGFLLAIFIVFFSMTPQWMPTRTAIACATPSVMLADSFHTPESSCQPVYSQWAQNADRLPSGFYQLAMLDGHTDACSQQSVLDYASQLAQLPQMNASAIIVWPYSTACTPTMQYAHVWTAVMAGRENPHNATARVLFGSMVGASARTAWDDISPASCVKNTTDPLDPAAPCLLMLPSSFIQNQRYLTLHNQPDSFIGPDRCSVGRLLVRFAVGVPTRYSRPSNF